jgi:Zn-dependent peptidase ImmA (M78 family)/DNA-binding XRE family transcriptional regulator
VAVLDAGSIGARIAEARARVALTQSELAVQISIDRSALAKIEGGTRRVSALELSRIADALGERIEWFVVDPPPAIVSHRKRLDEAGTVSAEIDKAIERATRNVEFLIDHDTQLQVQEIPQLVQPRSMDEAEEAASEARSLLGLNGTDPLLNVAGIASDLGLLTFCFDFGPNTADAASILLPGGAVILVNGHLHVGRRRLAVAHELGHCFFADEYTVDWRVADQGLGDNGWEARLDRFARALLLPSVGLGASWRDFRAHGDDLRTVAVKLASRFRVDMTTLARRLSELGFVNASEANRVRATRTNRADIVELNLLVHDELAPPALPRRYEASVLRLFRSEVLSASRATDLLFDLWEEDDLPVLPQLPQSAIWQFVS